MTDFLEHDTFSAWVTVDGGARLEVYEAYKERDPTNGKWTISGWIPSKSNQVCLLVYTSHDYKSPLIVFSRNFLSIRAKQDMDPVLRTGLHTPLMAWK
jgi:hypothetical protein